MKRILIRSLENTIDLTQLKELGHQVVPNLYTESEIASISELVDGFTDGDEDDSRSSELFSIRKVLLNHPELKPLVFNQNLKRILELNFAGDFFLTKSIYFDKPSTSNWFVAYHQDLSISVDQKADVDGYSNWTHKHGLYGVQPPLRILQNTLTLRIHLDDTTTENGALRVIQKSHQKGFIRVDEKNWDPADEVVCDVKRGGVMLMKPLTLHASSRTTNGKRRRVIHLEFCDIELDEPLGWLERSHI